MQNNVEVGTPAEGKALVTVGASGQVTIIDSQNNTMASGSVSPVADASYIYDSTANELSDPSYGIFTFSQLATRRVRHVPGQRDYLHQLPDCAAISE